MTAILVIVAYIFGALSGVFFVSLMIAGRKMDKKMEEIVRNEGKNV